MDINELKKIHYDLKDLLDKRDFQGVVQYTKIFDQDTNIGILRTALIIMKAFRDEHEISSEFNRLCDILEPQVKTL